MELASCFCHWMPVWSLSNLHQLFPFSQHLLVLIDLSQLVLQASWRNSCSLLCMDPVHTNPSCSSCVLQNTYNSFAFIISPKMPRSTTTKALSKSLTSSTETESQDRLLCLRHPKREKPNQIRGTWIREVTYQQKKMSLEKVGDNTEKVGQIALEKDWKFGLT